VNKKNKVVVEEKPYVVVNTEKGLAHTGYLEFCDGKMVELRNVRCVIVIGYETIYSLATKGPRKQPLEFEEFEEYANTALSVEVPSVTILNATEILFCSPQAAELLRALGSVE
jgi:hypothetical protein